MGHLSGLCCVSSIRLGVTGATPTLWSSAALSNRPETLSRNAKSVSSTGDSRSPLSAGAGDCVSLSGSTRIRRFLKGSLRDELSAGRLMTVLESGAPLTAEQRISKPLVPVDAGDAGERNTSDVSGPQFGLLDPALPRSLLVVRRSSGAVATDWCSPFIVIILGINWWRSAQRLDKFQVCVCACECVCVCAKTASRRAVSVQWGKSIQSGQPCAIPSSMKIKWAAIKSSLCVTGVLQMSVQSH